jgi:plasmid replication initiation protein
VHFLLKLPAKYAVTLYEILEGFANRRDGRCAVTIDDLRTWLKVPEGRYPTWKNFRLRALDPAIKLINDDPYGAGFSVEYTPIRKGRFYHEIVFQLTKTAKRIQTDRLIKTNAGNTKKIRDAKAKQRQFWAHWENKGKPDFNKGAAVAFKGFVDRKYRQMKQRRR